MFIGLRYIVIYLCFLGIVDFIYARDYQFITRSILLNMVNSNAVPENKAIHS